MRDHVCVFRGRAGFSLIELMVAMAILSVIVAHAVHFLIVQRRSSVHQEATVDAQQQARAALDLMSREIMLAGSGMPMDEPALKVMEEDRIEFLASLAGAAARLREPALPGQEDLSVTYLRNSGKFRKGKTLLLCSAEYCEWHRLAGDGSAGSVRLAEPIGRPFPGGSDLKVINRVRYDLKSMDSDNGYKLMRNVDGGSNPVAEGVESLSIEYLDNDGLPAGDADRIVRLQVRLTAATAGDPKRKRGLASGIGLRN
jgi:prepilin-type N-terminal cleavage/methylation domain-containing protein